MPVAAAVLSVAAVAAVAAAAVAANNRRRMHASRHSCCQDHCSLENSQKANQLALPGGLPTLLLPFLDFWDARTDECLQAWQVAVPPPAVAAVVPPPPCASSPPVF